MDRRVTSQGGFTLLELLVAMAIFAFIALGSHAMLRAVLEAHATAHGHAQTLIDLQKTIRLLEQDIRQMEPGDAVFDNDSYVIRFHRRFWPDPYGLPRSGRVTIAYGLRDGTLTRYYWPPGAAPDAQPVAQSLLSGVGAFQARRTGGLMEITFSQSYFGDIRRAIETAGP